MKKHMLFAFASFFVAVGSLHAQSVSLVANIPFDFVVGKAMLHAGIYTISPVSVDGSGILLRSSDLKDHVLLTPCTCASETTPQHESKLVFQVADGQYFLWQIWTQGYNAGRQLSIRAREAQHANLAPSHLMVVAAKIGKARGCSLSAEGTGSRTPGDLN